MPELPPPRPPHPSPPPPPPPGATSQAEADAPTPRQSTPEPLPSAPGLDDRERTLDRSIVTEWRLSAAAVVVVPAVVASVAGFALLDVGAWLVVGVVAAVVAVVVLWLPTVRYEHWHWRLSSLAIELRHGVVVHRQDAVPYFRIQQIDVNQGPLDRLLGLATLEVTTASASGSAALPGIAAEEAPAVRAELLVRAARAVGEHPGDLRDAV